MNNLRPSSNFKIHSMTIGTILNIKCKNFKVNCWFPDWLRRTGSRRGPCAAPCGWPPSELCTPPSSCCPVASVVDSPLTGWAATVNVKPHQVSVSSTYQQRNYKHWVATLIYSYSLSGISKELKKKPRRMRRRSKVYRI